MKRECVIVLFLLLAILSCKAQISRTIYGIPLLTSANNAKQILVNKGLKCSDGEAEYGKTIIARGDIFFANKRWEAIILAVKDNKVYSVGFLMYGNTENIGETFMSLGDKLKEKYSQYAQTPTTKETYKSIKVNITFDDNNTLLLTQCEINQHEESMIMLGYTDKVMYEKFQQNGVDEL